MIRCGAPALRWLGTTPRGVHIAAFVLYAVAFRFFKPELREKIHAMYEVVMRGPSPLSAGQRELIAAFTSKANHCGF